ncbi:MAG: DUF3817 domain-containing protein [Actinobacteria bacterium]|nr:DUF3817 domain-containing protein [Actinomycetota bacterium]
MTTIRAFRGIARAEALTGLLLAFSMIAKYGFDSGAATTVMGLIHGVVFLAYCGAAFDLRAVLRWNPYRFVVALAAAFVPLGTFFAVERVEDWAELERRKLARSTRRPA